MKTPGFRMFRKIGNPKKKREMSISEADAYAAGWELDGQPKSIKAEAPSKPFQTPELPESAKRAIPGYMEKETEQAEVEIPEVKKTAAKTTTKRTRKPRTTKTDN